MEPNGDRIAWCVEGQVIILDERLQEISRSLNQSHQVVALKWLSNDSIVSLHSNGTRLNINATTGEIVNQGQFAWPGRLLMEPIGIRMDQKRPLLWKVNF